MAVSGPAALILTLFTTGLSIIQHNAQRRRLKRERRRLNSLDIRPTSSGSVVSVPYGRTAVQGVIVYKNTQVYAGRHDTLNPPTSASYDPNITLRGELRQYDDYEDLLKEFLLYQIVIGPAGVHRIVDSVIQSETLYPTSRYDANGVENQYWNTTLTENILDGSNWSRQAVHMFGPNQHPDAPPAPHERFTDTTRGVGLAYVSRVHWRNLDTPAFGAEPEGVTELVEGMKTAPLATGVNPITATKTFSTTMPRALYHFLTQSEYGPGFFHSQIDLDSFIDSERVASIIIQGSLTETVAKNQYVTAAKRYFKLGDGTVLQDLRDKVADEDDDEMDIDQTSNSGVQAGPATGTAHDAESLNFRNYEFNGVFSTDEDHWDVVQSMLSVAPGTTFFRSETGKWKLRTPDPSNVTNRITTTINEGDLVAGSEILIDGPDPSEYRNQLTGRFANMNKNYAEDTITFPTTGSVLHNSLLDEDNNIHHHGELDLEGANNKYQAQRILANVLFQSRRNRYQFTTLAKHLRLEPEDEVRLVVPSMGIDQNIIIKTKAYNVMEGNIIFTGVEYEEVDYVRGVTNRDTIARQEAVQYSLPDPTNVTISRGGIVLLGFWSYPYGQATTPVVAFDIQMSRDGGTTWYGFRSIAGNTRSFRTNFAFTPGTYKFRVAARGQFGNQSSFVESSEITVPSIIADGAFTRVRLWQLTECRREAPVVDPPPAIRVNVQHELIVSPPASSLLPWTVVEPITDLTYDKYQYAKWETTATVLDVRLLRNEGTPGNSIIDVPAETWSTPRVVDAFQSSNEIFRRGPKPDDLPERDGYTGEPWLPWSS